MRNAEVARALCANALEAESVENLMAALVCKRTTALLDRILLAILS